MKCAGGCGREIGRAQAYCTPACHDRFDRLMARARDIARRSDETIDRRLDELKLTPRERRVLAVLRDAGIAGAVTAQLVQPEVGGARASGRVHDLRQKGFQIDAQAERVGSHRYRLRGEPGDASPAPAPVTPAVETTAAPNLLRLSSTAYGPYDDFDEAA